MAGIACLPSRALNHGDQEFCPIAAASSSSPSRNAGS
jgi:hypothetical protein